MIVVDLTERATPALMQWRSRSVFPTDFASVDLRGLSRELRMQSVFSARVTNAHFLGEVAAVIDDMLAGKINMADGRLRLLRKLAELGYDPEVGFPGDMAAVPPAERGSLQDLSSEARLNLILETNQRMAANYGLMVEGNTPYALYAYPAWELVRLYTRNVPRGTPESHSVGWARRWNDAGESVGWDGAVKNPMIARKDSPIWEALGQGTGGHDDTLGNPFPPFAFQSGMGWRVVDRARCVELGLIDGVKKPASMKATLLPTEEKANEMIAKLPPDLIAQMKREIAENAQFLRDEQEKHRARQAGTERMGVAA